MEAKFGCSNELSGSTGEGSESLSLTPCMVALSRCLGNFSALATQRRDCFGASVCYNQGRKWETKKE